MRGADPEALVRHVDVLDLAPGWVSACYGDGFELLAARAPLVWRGLYRLTDGEECGESRLWTFAERVLFRRFRRLVRSEPWDLCLSTHFLPCQLAAGQRDLPPIQLVVTDFTLHRYWVQPAARRTYVALDAMRDELVRRIPGSDVEVTGIPVGSRFAASRERAVARVALGLDPGRPVLLVVSGGMGLRLERSVEAALAAGMPDLQVLAVCGRNEETRRRLEQAGHPRLRVLGFVDRMERAIAAADLVLTKPGGLTISETLAVGRPLLLTTPIPGHEEENARVLVREGAARFARRAGDVTAEVGRLFENADALAAMETAARGLGRPAAAEAIVASSLAACRKTAVA